MRFEPREKTTPLFEISVMITSVILSFVALSILLFTQGKNPIQTYKTMFNWAFFNPIGLQGTLVKFVPLSIIGLGLLVAFKMKIWNIGGEGQYHLGAIGATLVALFWFPHVSIYLLIPIIFIVGAIAGGLWGAIPGLLKAYLGADEIVATLMLNYIGILFMDYLVYGPWKDPHGYSFPMTATFTENAKLPIIWGKVHWGVIIPVLLAFLVWYIFEKTIFGYEIKVIGDNKDAARYAGMDVKKNILMMMIISGMFAGLAGAIQMVGIQYRLQPNFSPGYGYTAIIVAWLSRLNPFGVVIVAFLMGGLFVGCEILQILMKLPISITYIFQGMLFIFVLLGEVYIKYKIKRTR